MAHSDPESLAGQHSTSSRLSPSQPSVCRRRAFPAESTPASPAIADSTDSDESTTEVNIGETRLTNPDEKSTPTVADDAAKAEIPATRNFLMLAWYQVVVRTGWIFKTESIIMPAVLDLMGGSALLRGFLPVLNRFGQSVPPMVMARRIKVSRYKKHWLTGLTFGMGACFAILSGVWLIPGGRGSVWLPLVFLALYGAFFVLTGLNQLVFSLLQGKLIRPDRRGRQLVVANLVGAVSAIGFAAWLLPAWLSTGDSRFELVFGMTALCFVLATFVSMAVVEPADAYESPPRRLRELVAESLRPLRQDGAFRLFAVVAAMFGSTMMIFPHYQALGRETLGSTLDNLMVWVVIQNIGTAVFSLLVGPVADRFGNRLALQGAMLMLCGAPLLSIVLIYLGPSAENLFPLVFALLGSTPVTIKLLINYTLEFSPDEEHPRYVSTLGLCISGPIMLLSPIVGWLVDLTGFVPVFASVVGLVLVGWLVTFFIHEPRERNGDM